MAEKYVLTMDRETALMVRRASELYARVVFGQFGEVALETLNAWSEKYKDTDFCAMRDQAEAALKQARAILFPELHPNSSYGVGHNHNADVAWNVNQVIRYAIAWHDQPEGGYTVNFNPPMSWSDTPLPSFSIVEDDGND